MQSAEKLVIIQINQIYQSVFIETSAWQRKKMLDNLKVSWLPERLLSLSFKFIAVFIVIKEDATDV